MAANRCSFRNCKKIGVKEITVLLPSLVSLLSAVVRDASDEVRADKVKSGGRDGDRVVASRASEAGIV